MTTNDIYPRLKNARKSLFSSVPQQCCQFHMQQNGSAHVPKESTQSEVHDLIRKIFNMLSKEEAAFLLKGSVDKYKKISSKLAQWLGFEAL